MRAGRQRHQVTIRAVARTDTAGGGWTEATSDVATVWAQVEPLEGNEQLQAMQTGMQRPHRFTLRYREGLTGASELLYAGRTFNVRSVVDPEERHRELQILADEIIT